MIVSSSQNKTDNYLDINILHNQNTLNKLRTQLSFSRPAVATNDHTCCGPKECNVKLTHAGARGN